MPLPFILAGAAIAAGIGMSRSRYQWWSQNERGQRHHGTCKKHDGTSSEVSRRK